MSEISVPPSLEVVEYVGHFKEICRRKAANAIITVVMRQENGRDQYYLHSSEEPTLFPAVFDKFRFVADDPIPYTRTGQTGYPLEDFLEQSQQAA